MLQVADRRVVNLSLLPSAHGKLNSAFRKVARTWWQCMSGTDGSPWDWSLVIHIQVYISFLITEFSSDHHVNSLDIITFAVLIDIILKNRV